VERFLIEVRGTVQGVGFRPHVYSLASSLGLCGFVQNRGAHLFIDLEGEASDLQAFMSALATTSPARAVIDDITCHPAMPAFRSRFTIAQSDSNSHHDVRVSPDIATCDACLDELFDPRNRRYRYPFITCAQCGPRFTIITGVPYDRFRTTMSGFAMCETCRREYENPSDRRFHAESIACADCGPTLELHECDRAVLRGSAAIEGAVAALCQGRIVALKGLGGYHLACDAANGDAVAMLRTRKHRDAKPFAIMVTPSDACHLQQWPGLCAVLNGPERPIVLVDRAFLRADISTNVAPGCPTIGVMRPYTPLHHLLMRGVSRPLVMTSGNVSDEPIAFDDEDARHRLSRIADVFITHDRPIHTRCDDSVVRLIANAASPVRRARGFAPASLTLREQALEPILATGGHLKNTFCLHAGSCAWISSHVGDLSSAAAYVALREGIDRTTSFLNLRPAIVAHDLHPDYLSTRFAEEYPAQRRVGVQHHHAHVLSCAAEHRVTEPVLGVAFDGSGLGTDGAVWGGEFLLAEGSGFTRLAHLASVPLAGGDAAVREPWRMAVAHLTAAGHGAMFDAIADRIGPARFAAIRQMIGRGMGAPLTSSVGRLFDAIASIAGVRDRAAFEGQAAMELERFADRVTGRAYVFDVSTSADPWVIDPSAVISAVADDVVSGVDTAAIAAGFHDALARMIADVAERLAARAGVHHVALTGGVFQNARLTNAAAAALERAGLIPLVHRQVPCNDAGLSLGQAVAAARILQHESSQRERPACV
jgi:hydrogenase maturation protein HypF